MQQNSHSHSHTQALEPETWDPYSLSRPFVTPTANFWVQEHKLELDVGTFSPNQYKSLCLSLYYYLSLWRAHKSTRRWYGTRTVRPFKMWSDVSKHTGPHEKKTSITMGELQREQNLAVMLSPRSAPWEIKYRGWLANCIATVPTIKFQLPFVGIGASTFTAFYFSSTTLC